MMKPLVIYHANCADGFGAAFAAWLKLEDEAEYLPMSYIRQWTDTEKLYPEDIKSREVYILDFSFPHGIMMDFFEKAKRVVWLDHHKTAFEMWCGAYEKGMCDQSLPIGGERHHICLDDNKSGAYLAWEFFHPGTEVPMLIKHIDDYDRWQFKIEGTKAFNKALWSYAPWSFELWGELLMNEQEYPETVGHMRTAGFAILRAHDQNVQSVVKGSARKCEIKCERNVPVIDTPFANSLPGPCLLPGLAANCPPHLTSDVGHELANQSGTFGLCWTLSKTGLIANCSLRSNGEYDVSAIATVFGGGGHRNAAGFEVPIQTLLGWLK